MTPFLQKKSSANGAHAEPSGDDAPARELLGPLLLEAGLLDQSQVEEAAREGQETGERLGEVVVRRGWASEDDVARVLAEQAGLEYLDRASVWFDANALTRLSREDALELEALPVRIQGDQVIVAVAEPTEDRVAELRRRIGDDAVVVVVPKTALDAGIDLLASRGDTPEEEAQAPEEPSDAPPPEPSVEEPPPPAAAAPQPAASPQNGHHPPELDLAAQARSFADSIAAQAAAMQEREERLEAVEGELVAGRAALQTLEAELAATRAAMDGARQQLATVLQLLESA